MPENELDISTRVREKFDFYLLSLIFVVLGLSLQTSKFAGSPLANGLELVSWVCLFVSGMSGLSRMRWIPSIHLCFHIITTREQNLKAATRRQSQGEQHVVTPQGNLPIDEFVTRAKKGVEAVNDQASELKKKTNIRYWLHVWGFAAGLFFLICSRGLAPASSIAERLLQGDAKITANQPSSAPTYSPASRPSSNPAP